MAEMIPKEILGKVHESERLVFDTLKKRLDDSHTVFHSLDMISKGAASREGRHRAKLIDAEIDFVILSRKGLVTLEVKGGQISFSKDGQWSQSGRKREKRDPFKQASDNKYLLKKILDKRLGLRPSHRGLHAVCFPDVECIDEFPVHGTRENTFLCHDLGMIDVHINRLLDTLEEKYRPTADEHKRIKRILTPEFEYGCRLSDKNASAARRISRFTGTRKRLIDFLSLRKEACIRGCAGSGKTFMAVEKALSLAGEGKSVLLLCYNKHLGSYLEESVRGYDNITACHYHRLCLKHINEAGIKVDNDGNVKFFDETLPQAFAEALSEIPLEHDAIIIDEGQDFKENYLITIEELRNKESIFYVFYDPGQNLFNPGPLPDLSANIGNDYLLAENCRNTQNIVNYLNRFSSVPMKPMDGMPQGEEVEEIFCSGEKEIQNTIKKILHRLVNEQRVPEEDIVILGGHRLENSSLDGSPKLGNFRVSENGEEKGRNIISYFTYMGFKGCESDVVILLDVNRDDKRWSDARLYTAGSRAVMKLFVVFREAG